MTILAEIYLTEVIEEKSRFKFYEYEYKNILVSINGEFSVAICSYI